MQTSFRRATRLSLFALLVASVVTALMRQHLWTLNWPRIWAFVPALTFAAFTGVFAADRLMAVRTRGASAPRAMFQVGAAIVFLTLLWPEAGAERLGHGAPSGTLPQAPSHDPLAPALVLLKHPDGQVRAAACSLLTGEALGVPHPRPPGHPLEGLRHALEALATGDAEPEVRLHCAEALGQLPPADMGLEQGDGTGSPDAPDDDDSSDDDDAPLDDDLTQET